MALAGILLLSGKFDAKGRFSPDNETDPRLVRRNIRFLRNFAEARAASSNVVRIRSRSDDSAVKQASCELIEWLDRVDAAYSTLSGTAETRAQRMPLA